MLEVIARETIATYMTVRSVGVSEVLGRGCMHGSLSHIPPLLHENKSKNYNPNQEVKDHIADDCPLSVCQ